MAFSATIRGQSYLVGTSGGVRLVYGDWTGSAGDAAGSLQIGGPKPMMVIFQKFDPIDNTYQIIPRVESSTSGQITTITVENQDTVTTGSFVIIGLGQ